MTPQKPRKGSVRGAGLRRNLVVSDEVAHKEHLTVTKLLHYYPDIDNHGDRLIEEYLERNMSQEHHRAIAIRTFNVARRQWGCNLKEAYSLAADISGVSLRTTER